MTGKYLSVDDFIVFLDEMQYPVSHLTVEVPDENIVIEIGNQWARPRIYKFISEYAIDTFNSVLNTEGKIVAADITIIAHKK